ncbi:septum formation family protein [Agreia pratensis]|uniref:Septum formation n=1 Tax=Agreia pratensis TaxID=150121 RepID=A0A1X7JK93_9MICO|nr:septum formation family protein [Agreia pratensis]SMG27980.1 Septum formation [Agreia pratensis]
MTEPVDAAGASGVRRPTPRWLVVAVAALAAVFVVVLFFVIGRHLPWFDEAQTAAPTSGPTASTSATPAAATPTPTPTAPEPAAAPTGPAAAGVHPWNELRGGECLDPFGTPWDETFTVVDCAAPHAAQLIARVSLNPDPAAVYPGEAAITSQLNLACTAPTVLDFAAASAYPDVQWQASYPVSEAQWAAGQREYSCFVSRSSGEKFTASVQAPPAA